MKKLPYSILALLFTLTLAVVQAKDATATTNVPGMTAPASASLYFDPATVDYKALLPDPPAEGSPANLKEIEFILEKQKSLTLEEVARIKEEQEHLSVWLFANVLGAWFAEKNLPATAVLFKRVGATVHPVVEGAKEHWARRRPFQQDARVHPPIPAMDVLGLSKNASYPSGHSTAGNLDALILAELAPDIKDALLSRGKQIGDDRVLAGVHFPSDVDAGHTLAHALFEKLMASPAFQDDLVKAKAEVAAARGASNGAKP